MRPMGKYAIVFALLVGAIDAAWFLRALRGSVATQSVAERPPPLSARSTSTGWRQYHFWHSGISGGK
jgi:hypothetical protein